MITETGRPNTPPPVTDGRTCEGCGNEGTLTPSLHGPVFHCPHCDRPCYLGYQCVLCAVLTKNMRHK